MSRKHHSIMHIVCLSLLLTSIMLLLFLQPLIAANNQLQQSAMPMTVCSPDDFGYVCLDSNEVESPPLFNWIDISETGDDLGLGNTGYSYPITLPFPFTFYDQVYHHVAVSAEGVVYFEDQLFPNVRRPIPTDHLDPQLPQSFIAVHWQNLSPGAAGDVYYTIMGTAPNRALIVQWQDVLIPATDPENEITVQVILQETSNNILMQYLDPSDDNGGNASIGIQISSTLGLRYSYRQPVIQPELAVCITPPNTDNGNCQLLNHDEISQALTITPAQLPYRRQDPAWGTTNITDPIPPCGDNSQGYASLWYNFHSYTEMNLVAHTYGSSFDTIIAVWQGMPDDLTSVTCDDDASNQLQSEVKFTAQANTTYYFQVVGKQDILAGQDYLAFNISQADKWTQIGPKQTAPSINAIVINPQTPTTLYAVTGQGVYRSVNDGANWVAVRDGLGTFGDLEVTSLVLDPDNSQIAYISTFGGGIFKSSDGGENWSKSGLSNPGRYSIHIDDGDDEEIVRVGGSIRRFSDPDQEEPNLLLENYPYAPEPLNWSPVRHLAIHPTNSNRLIAAMANTGMYLSVDSGVSWTPLAMSGATGISGWHAVFATANIAYASMGSETNNSNGGIFRSSNGGDSWAMVSGSSTITSVVTHIAVHPDNPDHVLVTTYGQGIMSSIDGGSTWTSANTGITDMRLANIAFSPVDANILYATGLAVGSVWKSEDGGQIWQQVALQYTDADTVAIALHPSNANVVYIGSGRHYTGDIYTGGGVYKSINGGTNFTQFVTGMSDTYVMDVQQDPHDPNLLYAGTWESGFYRSTDGGITWVQGNAGLDLPYIYSLAVAEGVTGTVLYAATFYDNRGLFVSYDQGQSWLALPVGTLPALARNIFDIALLDGDPERLVIATGNGIYTSSDGGQNWAVGYLGAQPTNNIIFDLEVLSGVSNHVVAGTSNDGIYYSVNGGISWSKATGVPVNANDVPYRVYGLGSSTDPQRPLELYAASKGLLKSVDGGINWQQIAGTNEVFFRSVSYAPITTGHIYAGSIGQGMWVSPRGSGSWFLFSEGFGDLRVRKVNAQVQMPERVMVATDGWSAWMYIPHQAPIPFDFQLYLPIIVR